MGQLINTIDNWTLVRLVGGLALIVSAVVGFFTGVLRDYMGSRWRANQERDLESLKHQFGRTEMLLNSLTATGSHAYLATNERRLDHFQKLWNAMIRIKGLFPTLATMAYSILTRAEVENLPTTDKPSMRSTIQRFDPDKYFDAQYSIVSEIESSRPFVGQRAWNAFFSYQALHGRLVYLLQAGLSKGKVTYWIDDRSFIDQVLGISIAPDNIATLLRDEPMAFHNIRNFLELEIVNEIGEQTSGSAAMKETVKQAQELSEAMSSAKIVRDPVQLG